MSIVKCKKCKVNLALPYHIEDKKNYICEGCNKEISSRQNTKPQTDGIEGSPGSSGNPVSLRVKLDKSSADTLVRNVQNEVQER